jgi:hypothetical protein
MNEVPPGHQGPDDVGDLYRHAPSLDASRPSELARSRILNHAAQLAEERRTRAAARAWRRPAFFGTFAAAALAGLLIAPRLFTPDPSLQTATSLAQNAARAPQAAADHQPHSAPPPEARGVAKPQALARNSGPSAKNAPASGPSTTSAQSQAGPVEMGATAAGRIQDMSAPQAGAVAALSGRQSDPSGKLRRAAEIGDISELQTLLDQKISIDERDEAGRTALMLAALHGQSHAVDVLLANGADPNAADAHGTTPMQAAIAGDQRQIVLALQRAGAR